MAKIHLLRERATPAQIAEMLEAYSDIRMIKIVADVRRKVLAGGSGMHYECEQLLLDDGSVQDDIWEANWYPDEQEIEFESLINARGLKNRGIIIQSQELRNAVEAVTRDLVGGVMP